MSERFGTPMTKFNNYVKKNPDTPGPRMQPAAQITEKALEHVKKYWGLDDVRAGDYLLLHPNGNGELMRPEHFERAYVKAHTTA